MFSYLSKKIAIPNNAKLKCLAWNGEEGWIACGSEQGMLKVLKLEEPKAVANAPSNSGQGLNANQTLQGHADDVVVAAWNAQHNKLTTSDSNGLIIVWILHKGLWFEEMINNRNKSVVRDMRWAADGSRICIAYEDGAVIMGGVDGNRIWGKELKMELALVAWSPDSRRLLFCTTVGECHIIDAGGNPIAQVPLRCKDSYSGDTEVVGLEWYSRQEGYCEPGCPVLAVCLRTGPMQLMKDELDDACLVLNTGMQVSNIKWNSNGSVLAVSGVLANSSSPAAAVIQFYSCYGQHLRTLRVPGSSINALAWEKGGLRIALAVESFVYFANVQPSYHWGYFAGTVMYAFSRPDRPDACVVFWDLQTKETHAKYVKRLIAVKAAGQNCILVARGEEKGQCNVILCDSIGTPIDSNTMMVEPLCLAMTSTHVIAASNDTIFVWMYNAAAGCSHRESLGQSKLAQSEATFRLDTAASPRGANGFQGTQDPITAVTAAAHMLLIGRSSGDILCYTLPDLVSAGKHTLRCKPQALALNCDATRMSIIDFHGVLSFYDFHGPPQQPGAQGGGVPTSGEHLAAERKDVWNMVWSEDSPGLFAMMEKGRMYIFRGLDPEEPVQSSARLCYFKDLEVTAVLLDDMIKAGTKPQAEHLLQFETRSLRDTRQLLSTVPIADTMQFIEQNPHPRLWRALAEHALKARDFETAEKSFVRCAEYQGIQIVKQLRRLDAPLKQDAEIALYLKQYEEAEASYRRMDRPDLAIDMHMRRGDWLAAEKLLKQSSRNDALLVTVWNKIGDHHADRQKWYKAASYYAQAKNSDALADALYRLEDFDGLEQLTAALPEGAPLLLHLGERFQSVGLCQQAANAYIKGGDVNRAVDCCVVLSQWDQAVALAQEHSIPQVQSLLFKYAAMLLEQQKIMEAVQLYRKAHFHKEAAQLLLQLAKSEADSNAPPLRIKKLYVLAALEADQLKARMLNIGQQTSLGSPSRPSQAPSGPGAAADTLAGLVDLDAAGVLGPGAVSLVNAWHGAQAYHFWLLAHRHLYSGNTDAAMRTALHLRRFDDVLDPKDVYSLLGLTAFYNGFFGQCSKAFTRLESLSTIEESRREQLADLAMAIFVRDPPNDPKTLYETREHGSTKLASLGEVSRAKGSKHEVCVASGKLIKDKSSAVCCKTCGQYTSSAERQSKDICAMCHSLLPLASSSSIMTSMSYFDTDMEE